MNTTSTKTTPPANRQRRFPYLMILVGAVAAGGCVRVDNTTQGKGGATSNRSDDGPASHALPTSTLEPPTTNTEPASTATTRTIAAGTGMAARLDTTLDSGVAKIGDEVSATTTAEVRDSTGQVAFPAGTVLTGQVSEVQAAQRIHKMASLAFHFERAMMPDGRTADISATQGVDGTGWTKKQGAIIGGSAAGGAVLGQVLGSDNKSTIGGAIVGGAIATGVIMSHKGEDVVVSSGSTMQLTLDSDVVVGQPIASL